MHDPFEQSLREMLKAEPSNRDDDACLGRVLKTANRQVGAGDLFSLLGRWMQALMIALNSGSAHIQVKPSAIVEITTTARVPQRPSTGRQS